MRTKYTGCMLTVLALGLLAAVPSAQAQLWKQLVPASHVEEVSQGDHQLTQENGPWLIMAASFQGDGAEIRAGDLARELREKNHLTAYVHDQTFNFSEGNPGRGLDDYGAPVRTRYRREKAHEFAVLVGDFSSIDDPDAQKVLEQIKTMQPDSLKMDDDPASNIDQVRQFSAKVLDKFGKPKQRGPMGKAFLTRNPLLPREYFVPKGVDDFVAKMNKGVEHGLLDCPGKYTVQVATFRGKTLLQTSDAKTESSAFGWTRKKGKDDSLVEAAEDAHLLTEELRAHGWEAFEFHDRTESIVAIGSFDQIGQRQADGRVSATPQVQKIIETFGAAYNTPSDPLTGDDIRRQRQAEEMKQQFTQMLNSHDVQAASGMNPKHVKIMRGRKIERIIPIDVYPHTIEVPRRTISGAYSGN